MKIHVVLFSAAVFTVLARSGAAEDHLVPEPGIFGQLDEYELKVRQVFAGAYDPDVLLRVVIIASFRPEEVAGIRKTDKGYEAFAMKPSSTVWNMELVRLYENGQMTTFDRGGQRLPLAKDESFQKLKKETPADVHQITTTTESAPLALALAERIERIWQRMLLDARHVKKPSLGTDGAAYHFSMWIKYHGIVSASVWSPDEHTRMGALVNLSYELADYARDKSDAQKLANLLKPLE